MATSRRTAATSASALVVQQLADLFRANGHRAVTRGDSKVCFTSESLTLLNNYFQTANLNSSISNSSDSSRGSSILLLPQLLPVQHLRIDTKLRDNLVFLHEFLQKIQVVKLIHNAPTLQGNVLLYPFQNIVCLELKKIPVHMLVGLATFRHQLETLICSTSIENLEDLICACGGDSAEPQNWPRLKSLLLSHNTIERIDQSLKYLPALEVLDLSHNRLKDCSKILDIVPHVKHLNLSSNHLRNIPLWPQNQGSCGLLTLKMRQNSLEKIKGIEVLKSLEDLDLSDNFIIHMPEEIRQLSSLKRVVFARNPFTYDVNYRQKLILNLPYAFNQGDQELIIDNQPLTTKERQKIPSRRNRTSDGSQGVRIYSPTSTPLGTTTSESTEGESIAPSSVGSTVSRRRPQRKNRKGRLQNPDPDITPTEQHSSNSDTENTHRRPRRLNRVAESTQEIDNSYLTKVPPPSTTTTSAYSSGTMDPDERTYKLSASTAIASTIPRNSTGDSSQTSTRYKSPRSRKVDQPNKIVLEIVDIPHTTSDDTAEPDTPPPEANRSSSNLNHQTPIPVLEPKYDHHEQQLADDSIRSTFFVTNNRNRSFMIDLEPMYLVERDINDEDHLEKIKYSLMKLSIQDEDDPNKVEFTFEKKRNEFERRTYYFDTIHDHRSFIDEVERHLEMPSTLEFEPIQTEFLECSKCGKTFPPLSMNHPIDPNSPSICISCQNPPATEIITGLQLNTTIDISSDEIDLDHRLHFQVATEHFSHDNEQIKLHFKCFAVRSTTSKYFIARTILTNYGIYIFQCESNQDTEFEYILVGKDLLTNVLMLDIGYRLQTFTIELQSAAFAFLLAKQEKTQKIVNHILEVLSPIVQSGEGALQKISRISSDEYRQRLFEIIKIECLIDEPNDDMIDFYSIIIRRDQAGNNQMIALLLLENWILMIEDEYASINSRHVRLPSRTTTDINQQLKCDLMHLVNVINYVNHPTLFVFDFVDQSETKQFRWKLEALTNESKTEFLTKVRNSYKKFMGISLPETAEVV